MLDKEIVVKTLQHYNALFNEETSTQLLTTFLTYNKDLYHRKNFNGHITSSAFLISYDNEWIYLLYHETLHQWFQPGGHVEEMDVDILSGSARELQEESGYIHFIPITIDQNIHLPIDIDSHWIPENQKKEEDGHYHHDFRYLFRLTEEVDFKQYNQDHQKFKWIPLQEFCVMDIFKKSGKKITSLLAAPNSDVSY
jgi:8-oxo-dGTP pyrophosphatase MutT (NUDIX family)